MMRVPPPTAGRPSPPEALRNVAGGPDLSYDAAGNLTGHAGSPADHVWDYLGRLAQIFGKSSRS